MKPLWKALDLVRRCAPALFARRVVYVLLQSVLPLAGLWVLKAVVDAVTLAVQGGGGAEGLPMLLLALAALFLLQRTVAALAGVNDEVLRQRLVDHMSDLVQRQAARLDMAYYDTPDYHDTLHRAQQEAGSRPVAILTDFLGVLGAAVSILVVTLMLASASWWIVVVMVVAVLPSFFVRLRKARLVYRFRRDNTPRYRRTSYYGSLLTSRGAAQEMRAYGLAPWFRRRFVEERRQLTDRLLALSRRLGAASILCAVVEVTALLAVAWVLVSQALTAAISLGSFVMLFEAFRRGQGYLNSLVAGVADLYDNRLFVGNLFEFLAIRPAVLPPDEPLPVPERIGTVELRDVCFRYPGMQRDVLHHFSLTARAGELTCIEGRNGFGKSTVVKLLLRLYDPQQGQVLVDGIDVRRFDPRELRRRFGVLFQDFLRLQCTAAENIALGDADHPHAPVQRAAALAGADSVAEALPQGFDTPLGRLFDDGAELSMGQWQRVALARALQADAPVLLLDEPMAWLDTPARQHLEASLQALARDKIVILITHI